MHIGHILDNLLSKTHITPTAVVGLPPTAAFLLRNLYMAYIIRTTTPTLKYMFPDLDVTKITLAYLTIDSSAGRIEKDLTTATVDTTNKFISWTLTQAETKAFGNSITAMVNWKLQDGTRGASAKTIIMVDENLKDDVI